MGAGWGGVIRVSYFKIYVRCVMDFSNSGWRRATAAPRHPDAWPKVMEMMCEGEGQGGRGSPEREELAGIWQKHALLTQVPTPGPRSRPQSSPLNR